MIDFIFGLYYDHNIQKVPPIKNDLLLTSASELAERIRYFISLFLYIELLNIIYLVYVGGHLNKVKYYKM